MLQLITGRSGSGKSQKIFENIGAVLHEQSEARIFLIVPEQASYENERYLLEKLGSSLSQRVQVLSFTRMAETVLRQLGGGWEKRMDQTVSMLLMSQAFSVVADHLQIFRRHCEKTECLEAVLSMYAECKQCGISARDLLQTSSSFSKGVLRSKTEELSLIFEAYETLVAQADKIDPLDDLTVLAKRLPESHLFDDAYIFVDGFNGFTGQEFSVLEQLLVCSRALTVSLCSDRDTENTDPAEDLFFTANRTAIRLRELAYKHHVSVAKILRLSKNKRTDDPALLALEKGCYAPIPQIYEEPTDSVQITPCSDRLEECRYAARTVRRLLRENGGYCRDFTIVVRHLDQYSGMLESALKREGLPFYIDERESILSQPLITLLESALSVVLKGWDTADILRLCKTGLVGFSAYSASQLENYAFIWNIHGKQWQAPFTKHPEGLGFPMDERAQNKLFYLNLLRRRIIEPLTRLQTRLSGNRNGQEFSTALWQFLQELRIPRMIRFQAARLKNIGEAPLAEHQSRLWDHITDLLNTFAVSLQNAVLPCTRFYELFHLAVSCADLGVIPQTLDGVRIGAANRIRYTHPKTVILLGANEGVFPSYPTTDGMLTDAERRKLISAGLPMTDDADHQAAEERYYAYTAVSAPSERLIVTYAHKGDGEPLLPSSLVENIKRILPAHAVGVAVDTAGTDTESRADAFSRMTRWWHEETVPAASFRRVFDQDPDYQDRMAALNRTSGQFAFQEPMVAKKLFGTNLHLSPSQVDTYHLCRFSYFCKYGIRLKPRRTAQLGSTEAGTLAHYVMQTLLPQYAESQWENCSKDRIFSDVKRVVAQYVQEYMEGISEEDSRFHNLIRQLTRLCSELMWRVVREFEQSRFVPVDYELPIGRCDTSGDGIAPWILTTPDGTTIQVSGKVDRVDVLEQEGKSYIRIVDYKTGQKTFDLSEVMEGINLQMLIYLFSICGDAQNRYQNPTPAGVLYLPAKLPVVRVERDLPAAELERKQLATMCMNGLLLDDPKILTAMEADLAGLFIPARATARGDLSKSSSLASLEQFGKIQHRIENLLIKMAQTLHDGDIAAVPADGITEGCRFCDFHDICGHEPDDPVRSIAHRDLKDLLQELEKEEEVPSLCPTECGHPNN